MCPWGVQHTPHVILQTTCWECHDRLCSYSHVEIYSPPLMRRQNSFLVTVWKTPSSEEGSIITLYSMANRPHWTIRNHSSPFFQSWPCCNFMPPFTTLGHSGRRHSRPPSRKPQMSRPMYDNAPNHMPRLRCGVGMSPRQYDPAAETGPGVLFVQRLG